MRIAKRLMTVLTVAAALLLIAGIYGLLRLDEARTELQATETLALPATQALADLHGDFDQLSRANLVYLDTSGSHAQAMLEHCIAALDARYDAELEAYDVYLASSDDVHRLVTSTDASLARFRTARSSFLSNVRLGRPDLARRALMPGGVLDASVGDVHRALGKLREANARTVIAVNEASAANFRHARILIVVTIVCAFVLACATAARWLSGPSNAKLGTHGAAYASRVPASRDI